MSLENFHQFICLILIHCLTFPPYYHASVLIFLVAETPCTSHFRCNARRKNVCESIFGSLLDIKGKSNDRKNTRDDLQCLGIIRSLWPQYQGKKILPPAPHTLSKKEKETFCVVLFRLKVPDGYSSNPRNHISMEALKFHSMKAHDCHVLMQQILPVALRHVLPKVVQYTISRLLLTQTQPTKPS